MPPNSEIEKLERRWKENPKGTVFAPYAEVLRKHGDYLEARDVLRQGLELHPDHIPGNIVLGRCCLDLREDGPAEAAFTHVLDLDPENVIALKALAEITERQGRLMEARGWLSRLIAVDPSNDEARDQLERVDSAREAAAAAITAPLAVQATPADSGSEITETVEVVARPFAPQPRTLTEAAAGEVSETGSYNVEGAIEAAFGGFEGAPAPAPAPEELDTAPILPLVPRESSPVAGLESAELDLAAASSEVQAEPIAGLKSDEPFTPPPTPIPASPDVFTIGVEEPAPLDLTPGGASEFQAPDGADDLLSITPGASEFQQPDPSQELTPTGTAASEYQTPSGAEDLRSALERPEAAREVEPSVPEPPPLVGGALTTGFAAISLMPTEELSTEPPAPPRLDAPVDDLTFLEPAAGPPGPPAGAEVRAAEPPVEPEPEVSRPSDLKLIFPDEAAEPEPPRVRRISQEVQALRPPLPSPTPRPAPTPAPPPPPEPAAEPEPVLTESMAELYARQGHTAEALNVYRSLLAKQPNDSRLAQRIRELEQQRAAGSRRLSYVAMDTGGESVESFFRSLADARPGSGAGEEAGEGAPTRPARDPLSLSAIFGEEPAPTPAAPSAPAGGPADTARAGDAFSFDQFFGAGQPGTGATGPRPSLPTEEDLDQFQHWLKSLKR